MRTDALGDVYNALIEEAGLSRWPKVLAVKGEDLAKRFGEEVFHVVYCANALDHFDSPAEAFTQMMKVCRAGGVLRIVSVENEGEKQQYSGLHRWNVFATNDGLYIADQSGTAANLVAGRADVASFEWEYLDHGQVGFNIIGVTIRKHARR